jgi:hypothetical protein
VWVSCRSSAHLLPMVSLCLDLPPDQGLGITCGSFSIEHLPLTRPKNRFSGCLLVQGRGEEDGAAFDPEEGAPKGTRDEDPHGVSFACPFSLGQEAFLLHPKFARSEAGTKIGG